MHKSNTHATLTTVGTTDDCPRLEIWQKRPRILAERNLIVSPLLHAYLGPLSFILLPFSHHQHANANDLGKVNSLLPKHNDNEDMHRAWR